MPEDKFSNHSLALQEIADELGVEREYVSFIINKVLFVRIRKYLKYPFIIVIPYLGRLVPDMRRYHHFEKKEEKLKKLKSKFQI